MKNLILLAASILMMLPTQMAYAYDYASSSTSGQTIYYNRTSPNTVAITYGYYKSGTYSGDIVLPEGLIITNDTVLYVTSIGDSAFYECDGLTSVIIPERVTSIGEFAFYNCKRLISITIPDLVTTIGMVAFGGMSRLTSISVGGSNTAFSSSDGVLFNKNQTTLVCFPGGKTGSYTIPNSVTTIGNQAFFYCTGLTSVTIPNQLTTIGIESFYLSGLTSVTIPTSVTNIGIWAFSDCSKLTTVNFNATFCNNMGVDIGGTYYPVFPACPLLTTLNIGNNVRNIPYGAFCLCAQLTSVTIPAGVTTIGTISFSGCTSLEWIEIKATNPPTTDFSAFRNVSTTIPVYVPCGSVSQYQAATGWDDFTNIIERYPFKIELKTNNSIMGTVRLVQSPCDGQAIIDATAKTGYRFGQWSDGNTTNPRTLTLTADTILTAIFTTTGRYSVNVVSNDPMMGSVEGAGSYEANEKINIYAKPNVGYSFIRWDDGNTQSTRTITVTQDITYRAIFGVETGITNINVSAVNVYPNPATDNINIVLPENISQAVFTLYDMQGKVLIHQEVNTQEAISVSDFASGIYIYNVRTNKQSYQGKLIRK